MVWVEFGVVLAAIVLGARLGGMGLGAAAGLGLAVLVFGCRLAPSSPPGQVLAIIIAVVTALSTMEAAGGFDYLVERAAGALRAHPRHISLAAPLVAYLFTFCAGTGYVAYALLPVIAETARRAGIRPERPLSISVIASQQAITASPISAATATMLALLAGQHVALQDILKICVPSTIAGVIAGGLVASRVGAELGDDPIYRDRLARGLVETPEPRPALEGSARRHAVGAVAIFLAAALAIVALGVVPSLRPALPPIAGIDRALSVADGIQILMYAAAALMLVLCRAKPDAAASSRVARAGMVAVVSVLGLGWLGSSLFEANRDTLVGGISGIVQAHPWAFAVGLFVLSILSLSQAATVAALMPVGVALGLAPVTLIAMFPATNGSFVLPTYGTLVAAVSFDRTGTTRIGRYVVDHSFMLPGLVSTVTAVGVGMLLARALGG